MHHAESSNLQLKNNTKYKQFKIAAISSGVALVFGGLAFLQPFSFTNNSYAEEVEKSSSAEMSVTVEPVIEIWTTDTNDDTISAANIALDPDESLATTTVRTHVSTSNTTGYTLTIQSESTDAKMTHEDSAITKTINPITGEGTSTTNWTKNKDLNNMWGYSIGNNDSYLGVPGSSSDASTINETSGPSNDSSTDVTFAAKADTTLPAGTYKDTVIFSAVANPQTNTLKQAAEAAGITTMQGMEGSTVCSEADVWQEGDEDLSLADSRTGQSYIIRKLEDEKCWMVQNLYLTGGTQITSSNSDITATSYTLPASTYGGSTFSNSSTSDMNDGSATTGSYYSWPVATAGTGSAYGSSTNNSPASSICPKGWKLPTGGSGGEFETLYGKYNSYSSFTGPWNFTAVGRYSNGSLGNTANTYYWSRTGDGDNLAYILYVSSSNSSVDATNTGGYKYFGYSVRCVLSS